MRTTLLSIFVVATIGPGEVFADYPERPITILVGYDTGSPGDLIGRGLAQAAQRHLAQPIVVMNRPGASGTAAISEALQATPDGYTLGMGTVGSLTVQPHRTKLSFGSPDSYVAVAKLVTQPNVLMVRAGAPWKTAREFLAYARAHPGELTVGVAGVATVGHLNLEQLKRAANVDVKVAFFDGPHQVQAALLGKVDAAIAGPAPIMPHVRAGTALALGVFDERRLQLSRDVPTFKEMGFDATLVTMQAIIAPQGTPLPVVKALAEAILKAVREPEFIALAQRTDNIIDYEGPEDLDADLRRSFDRNGELVRVLGLAK